jgi:dCMP deaminase
MDTREKKMIRIPRLLRDQFFMLQAHLTATRATCDRGPELLLCPGRHGVGAVLVRGDRAVATGFNGSPPGEPHCGDPPFRCRRCGATGDSVEGVRHENVRHWPVGENVGDPPLGDDRFVERFGGHLLIDGHCRRTLHAEENALLQCALDGVSPIGATVFTTASPCYDCAKRLVRVGVARVVHGATYGSRYGLSDEAVALLGRAGIEVKHLDVSGVLEG